MATIATIYWRSNEESVEGDKPQKAPVLESRETVPPSNSRADRVQGNKINNKTLIKLIIIIIVITYYYYCYYYYNYFINFISTNKKIL